LQGDAKRAMPFAASERHEVWSADVRHLDMAEESLVARKAFTDFGTTSCH